LTGIKNCLVGESGEKEDTRSATCYEKRENKGGNVRVAHGGGQTLRGKKEILNGQKGSDGCP